VSCHYDGGWWILHVLGALDVTSRVRFLDEVEPQARHAIALITSTPEDSFDVELDVIRPPINH
jgi:hypothetical protein